MEKKVSVLLSEDLLDAVRGRLGDGRSAAEFVEEAVWDFLERTSRDEQSAKDLEVINRFADELNQEAEEKFYLSAESTREAR
ncbi:MAG TPA: hypothetical protein VE685_22725 [Thermoanaerobaculia bacterium]|nr:hypothetical protein [Thermoanaerobaculia bacterium]